MTEMRLPAGLELLRPLISGSGRVEPAWIDHHNHMNVGYYGVAIDACLHGFTDVVDMGKAYRDTTNCGFFVLESHQTFKSEMRLGDEFVITCQLLDYSPKLMHIMAAMYRLGDDALAATAEYLWGHVDRKRRRVVPFPADRLQALAGLHESHQAFAPVISAGLSIGIKR